MERKPGQTVVDPVSATDTAAIGPAPSRRRFGMEDLGSLWTLLVLLVIIAIFGIISPKAFFTLTNLHDTVVYTAEVILLAIGETFVIISAGIDLSVGVILALSSVLAAEVMITLSGTKCGLTSCTYAHESLGLTIGLVAGLLSGCVVGFVNGVLVTRFKLPPFIVTLGTLGIIDGTANVITGGVAVQDVPANVQATIGFGTILGFIPVPVAVTAVFAVGAHLLLSGTRFGRYTYAIGSNAEGARLAGINVPRYLILIYTLCGFMAAVAGIIDLVLYNNPSTVGHSQDNLNAIAAVVIGGASLFGGVGNIAGCVIGALIPAVLRNGFQIIGVQPFWQEVAVGAVLIVAVYVDQRRRAALR